MMQSHLQKVLSDHNGVFYFFPKKTMKIIVALELPSIHSGTKLVYSIVNLIFCSLVPWNN